jgi:hypothetical protein
MTVSVFPELLNLLRLSTFDEVYFKFPVEISMEFLLVLYWILALNYHEIYKIVINSMRLSALYLTENNTMVTYLLYVPSTQFPHKLNEFIVFSIYKMFRSFRPSSGPSFYINILLFLLLCVKVKLLTW